MPNQAPTTLRKLYFHFLSNWIEYDRGDSFPVDLEPNGKVQNVLLSNVKGKINIVFSVQYGTKGFKEALYWTPIVCIFPDCENRKMFFESCSIEPKSRLYLPFSDWFRAKRNSVWFPNHSEIGEHNFYFGLIHQDFCVCTYS